MYTYTTPTIPCTFSGRSLDSADLIRVAIRGRGYKIVREIEAADIDTENSAVYVTLTQEETAALGSGQVEIQARIRYTDGTVEPTNIVRMLLLDAIDRVVI